DGVFQIAPGDLHGQRIRHLASGLLFVGHPESAGQRDPDWALAGKKLNVNRIGVPRGDGDDHRLVATANRLLRPALDCGEVVIHPEKRLAHRLPGWLTGQLGYDVGVKAKAAGAAAKGKARGAILRADALALAGFAHGFSTRRSPGGGDGDFSLGFTEDADRDA